MTAAEAPIAAAAPIVDRLMIAGDGRTFSAPPAGAEVSHVFGGQLLGQSVWAAGAGLDTGFLPHSVQCSFLAAPDPRRAISYAVKALHTGGSFGTRLVTASQDATDVAVSVVSFARRAPVTTWQFAGARDKQSALPPARARDLTEWTDAPGAERPVWWPTQRPAQLAYAAPPPHLVPQAPVENERAIQTSWLRCVDELPPLAPGNRCAELVHPCVLAWASDLASSDAPARALGLAAGPGRPRMSSLNHHVWFHRAGRADQWLVQQQECSIVADGRALTTTTWTNDAGEPVATIVQEGLIRGGRPARGGAQ